VGNDGFRTIKIRIESYEKLRALLDRLMREGWTSVAVNTGRSVSLANIVDEALNTFGDRKKAAR